MGELVTGKSIPRDLHYADGVEVVIVYGFNDEIVSIRGVIKTRPQS